MKVRPPETVVGMLGVIADSAWQPADIEKLSSVFPNWTLADGSKHAAAEYSMEDVLRSWENLDIQGRPATELGAAVNSTDA